MNFEALLRKIHKAKDTGLPFVVYRKPDEQLVRAVIQNDDRIVYSNDFLSSGFIMAPFNAKEKAILFADKHSNKFSCPISDDEYADFNVSDNEMQASSAGESQELHLKLVKRGIERIEKGDFVKIVLSRREIVRLKHIDITTIFRRLMSKYQSAFAYVWFHPEIGLWAGASPETLLKTKGNSFQTMALAGTQKYKDARDVSWGEKETREQQIVTDHIVASLENMELEVSDTYTRKAGNLLHLCTDIKGQLHDENSLKNLIGKLHPTAAVCGLPRIEVRDFILTEEAYDRSFYTGFLGELNYSDENLENSDTGISNGLESNLFVNLRCMQLNEKENAEAIIYVGGGITLDSDPLSEWNETVDKSLIMKSVINA
ncbi:chorismate-binding protein [Lutimonas halocynthiae]|uniref:chorismate-binding protein n=1 Tax=Lutimonas halocynthiae TaxID=1446477 RepID=UPI0025B60BC3|nr:chorismate-binding protein [Lutimonas halocynthiae]MDN3642320.1 chorismate-binding protein [Lutimonas halocynthiae]